MSILPKSFSRLPSLYTDFNLITSDKRLNKNKILLLRTYYFSLEWSKIILVLDDPKFELHSGFLRKWCPSQLWSFVAQPRKFAIHTCTRTFIFTEPESGYCLVLSPIKWLTNSCCWDPLNFKSFSACKLLSLLRLFVLFLIFHHTPPVPW